MPARRTSRPSARRKVRASMISTTRPSPCGSNAHPAAPAGPVAATTSMTLHVDSTAIHPPRLAPPVTPFMTLLSVPINYGMLAIRNGLFIRDRLGDEGGQMEVNGIAHIFLTASNFERSREFYRKLLPFLGMKPVIDSDTSYYC